MVTQRIYIHVNDRGICNHMSVLNAIYTMKVLNVGPVHKISELVTAADSESSGKSVHMLRPASHTLSMVDEGSD